MKRCDMCMIQSLIMRRNGSIMAVKMLCPFVMFVCLRTIVARRVMFRFDVGGGLILHSFSSCCMPLVSVLAFCFFLVLPAWLRLSKSSALLSSYHIINLTCSRIYYECVILKNCFYHCHRYHIINSFVIILASFVGLVYYRV